MGNPETTNQDVSNAGMEGEESVRWNPVKTLAIVTAVLGLYFSELLILVGGGAFTFVIAADIGGANLASWPALTVILFTVALAAPLCQAADYWGRKWLIVLPNILGIAGAIISSRATSMGMFIGGFIVGGVGFGSQGLFLAVVSEVLPRKYRSWVQAAANGANALGSILALSVGGYLVSKPDGWRTYFYICAAFQAVAVAAVALLYNPVPRELQITLTFKKKVDSLDWIAYILLGSGTVLFCLGLLWAQNPYLWTDVHVLAPLLVGAFLLFVLFIYAWRVKKDGLFHHDLFRNRNFAISLLAIATEGMCYMAAAVYFPTVLAVLQTGKMGTYEQSLCQMTGFCGFAVSGLVAGFYIFYTKSIRVPGILTFVFFLAFFVSMATITTTTPSSIYWGYILFFGVGLGTALVTFITAVQFATPPELIAVATGLAASIRSFGGSVGLAIFNAISASGFTKNLVPKVTAAVIPLGLPKDNIIILIAALETRNMKLIESVSAVTPEIIGAAGIAIQEAHVIGYRNLFIFGAAFMLIGIVSCAFLINPTNEFTAKIDAPIENLSEEVEFESKGTSEEQVENRRFVE